MLKDTFIQKWLGNPSKGFNEINSDEMWNDLEEIEKTAIKNKYFQEEILHGNSANTQSYYIGKNSLYKFAEEWKLNSWEFDCIKRIVRCRHKGQFLEDLNKTKALIDIYIKEQGGKQCQEDTSITNNMK